VPGEQDRQHRRAEQPRPPYLPPRVHLERDRHAAEHLDQADAAPASASPAPGGNPLPATHAEKALRIGWAWRLIALTMTLAVGMALGLGLALGLGRVGREPRDAWAAPTATQPATAPMTSVVIRPTASSACLETARRADEIIQLLITNRRTRAAKLLVAYTVASRQCRRDAAP
jgi:hypothetical protein